ncbi:22544_t:CDS:1, partial [Racocetra persica]
GKGKRHGGGIPEEMKVFIAVYFTGVNPNSEITSERENGKLFNIDCAAIILKTLGTEVSKYFDSISSCYSSK